MNKILLNQKGRNHIRIFPIKNIINMPEDAAERINLCKSIFVRLQNAKNAIRHYYYRNVKIGHQVTIYELDNKIYLINCIRDPDYNYVTTIYITDNLEDSLSIAKFLRANMKEITDNYREQIIDSEEAFKEFLKKEIAKA